MESPFIRAPGIPFVTKKAIEIIIWVRYKMKCNLLKKLSGLGSTAFVHFGGDTMGENK